MLFFFFFNDTATTEIYTLSLHDALPIFCRTDREDDGDGRDDVERDVSNDDAPGACPESPCRFHEQLLLHRHDMVPDHTEVERDVDHRDRNADVHDPPSQDRGEGHRE